MKFINLEALIAFLSKFGKIIKQINILILLLNFILNFYLRKKLMIVIKN